MFIGHAITGGTALASASVALGVQKDSLIPRHTLHLGSP